MVRFGLGGRRNEQRFSGCLPRRRSAPRRAGAITLTTTSNSFRPLLCLPRRTTRSFGPEGCNRLTGYYALLSPTLGWRSSLSRSQSPTGDFWLHDANYPRLDAICWSIHFLTTGFSSGTRRRRSISTLDAVPPLASS